MTLNEELATWVNTRHDWQKAVVARLCDHEPISDSDVSEIVDQLINGELPEALDIEAADVPGSTASGDAVALAEITEVAGINALLPGQTLSFNASGLTIVFGNNASGKSGYARLIRESVTARFKSGRLLGDVFSSNPIPQTATISYSKAGEPNAWRLGDSPSKHLSRIRFYDEDCGDAYVTKAAEVDYQPSALTILDQLSGACERISLEIGKRLATNDTEKPSLPMLHSGTASSRFLDSLSADTDSESVRVALALTNDHDSQLAQALAEEARLKGSDPAKEKTRLLALSREWSTLEVHAKELGGMVSMESLNDLKTQRQNAKQLREAARIASSNTFEAEPITNVGSETWRLLWEAARKFSLTEAYHDHEFPYTGEAAVCLLCQQRLSEEASDRLVRFETFVSDTTSRDADDAAESLIDAMNTLNSLSVLPTAVSAALGTLQEGGEDTASVRSWFEEACKVVLSAEEWLKDESGAAIAPTPLVESVSTAAADRAKELSELAEGIDDTKFAETSSAASSKVLELQDSKLLAEAQTSIEAEIKRLAQRKKIEAIKPLAATNSITTKRGELTEQYVTQEVRDHFTRETERLGLRRVTLNRTGRGRQQALEHQPGLVGSPHAAAVELVLSEGEQTALGLAGFLTEVELDASLSGVVFDDPVSSLDSERRTRVAQRLVELADTRQVIVFTHEITFVQALIKEAERKPVSLEKRSVQRIGEAQPGLISDELPWAAKDIPQRISLMESDLAAIAKIRAELSEEDYVARIGALTGRLSQTLERAVNLHIVNELVDRGKNEVRPTMLKILPRFTQADHDEYQSAYGKISGWAERHDNAPEENYVPPTTDEVAREIAWLKAWHKRVKSYAN